MPTAKQVPSKEDSKGHDKRFCVGQLVVMVGSTREML